MGKPGVLLLTTCYPSNLEDPSGVFIERLAREIDDRGYPVTVVCPTDGTFCGPRNLKGINTFRFGYFIPTSMTRLTSGMGGIPENLSRSALARVQLYPMMLMFLLQTLRHTRGSELIYANWLGAGIVGAIAGLLTGKPLVVSFRGDDGYLARDNRLWRTLTKWVSGRAAMITAASEEMRDIFISLGVVPNKVRVPRFGVDQKLFFPADAPREDGGPLSAVFVGALIEKKGPQDLLAALADPELEGVKLIMVGEGNQREKLQADAERLGLATRVEWTGLLPSERVAEILRSADLLLLPSYTEGKPNVIREAMACALPVIATRVGGIPELVAEGETALLHEPGDVDALRECLKTLVRDGNLRRRMGQAGLERLKRERVNWETTGDEFEEIFRLAMGSRGV